MAKWDSKNLEIRSKSVEQTLVPLVTQVGRFLVVLRPGFDERFHSIIKTSVAELNVLI